MDREKIIVRNDHEIRSIEIDRLLAIVVRDYLCSFYIENEPTFTCSKSLKEVNELLPDFFVRINRNCIVNAPRVKTVNLTTNLVIFSGNLSFKYSKRRIKLLKDIIFNGM